MSSDQSGGRGRGRAGIPPLQLPPIPPPPGQPLLELCSLPQATTSRRDPKRKSEKEKGERMKVKRGKRVGWARQRRGSLFRANWVNLKAMEKETRKTD